MNAQNNDDSILKEQLIIEVIDELQDLTDEEQEVVRKFIFDLLLIP